MLGKGLSEIFEMPQSELEFWLGFLIWKNEKEKEAIEKAKRKGSTQNKKPGIGRVPRRSK